MNLEVEIKAKILDIDFFTTRLNSLKPKFISNENHIDIYFNHPEKNFTETDEALRIRSINGSFFITYKGPKLSSRSKTRNEIETEISSALECKEIFNALNFVEIATIEKNRKTYKLNDITICTDTIKDLGTFVELEKIAEDINQTEDDLFSLGTSLGIKDYIQNSYLELIQKNEKKC